MLAAYEDDLGLLRRLAFEGLYWQDEIEELLVAIRDGGDLGELSRAGGGPTQTLSSAWRT